MVGNHEGYLPQEFRKDVYLLGKEPPTTSIGGSHINTYLCTVEYLGEVDKNGIELYFDGYYVIEWYPLYPVKRDTLLPDWLFPKEYMTFSDKV